MPVDRLDFDNITEGDLKELLATQVPEGLRIEYKRDLYGNSDADRREALKDISGLANAFGGHLIVGVEEQDGLPVAIPGILNVSPDDIVLRLEQLVRDGIEPRIQGLRIRAVPVGSGAYCFVLRVPRSWYPPHRVSAQNSNRYWIRNSGGLHEASVEELRTLFTLGTDAIDRVHRFRNERLNDIVAGKSSRPLQGGGRLILHIVPLSAVTSTQQIDLARVHGMHAAFRPMNSMGMTPRFNFEGFVNERGGQENLGYTQVFRNGALESTRGSIIRENHGRRFIPGRPLERYVFEVLSGYINGLRDIGVAPPLVVLLTLEGVTGVPYEVRRNDYEDSAPAIDREILYTPDCLINEYATDADYHRAVRPAFDALWNSAGRVAAQSFAVDGTWDGDAQN